MQEGDRALSSRGQWGGAPCELLIIGGGVMGLWAALKAGLAGLDVLLVDAGRLGEGASHGHLGALMAHMPDKWNAKKQFQFEALLSLEQEIKPLEALTGLSAGYRRSGRLIPLPKSHLRDIALRHQDEAKANWCRENYSYEWRVVDAPPLPGWPSAEGIGGGFVLDTFAARANPRAFTAVLIASLKTLPNVRIAEHLAVERIDPDAGRAILESGDPIVFGHCVIAAGYKSFGMIENMLPGLQKPLGMPVKGQSALMAAEIDPALPLIFLDGLYVIPHEGGRVAIGSTSENRFDDASSTDQQLDELIARARALVPALRDAPVIDRWAGLRPKAMERDPMVGPIPECENVLALTGGFKVSFGIAHQLADAVVNALTGAGDIALPETFLVPHHVS